MAIIPPAADPTLKAAEAKVAEIENGKRRRGYLGMSAIGDPCARKVFYSFRWAGREAYDFASAARFEDGHRTEALVIERLRLVDGLTLIDRDEGTGKQYRIDVIGGHYSGGCDGLAQGLLQAPVTWHVAEIKCCSEKKINELKAAITTYGEKSALKQWNVTYWAQGQEYMHYFDMDRHWLVAATPGGRDWLSVRTERDRKAGEHYTALAESIIAGEIPNRVSRSPDYWICRNCVFAEHCHRGVEPDRNCRTCRHSEAISRGSGAVWHCNQWHDDIPRDQQEIAHECWEAAPWTKL